jgi:hypothetical protein
VRSWRAPYLHSNAGNVFIPIARPILFAITATHFPEQHPTFIDIGLHFFPFLSHLVHFPIVDLAEIIQSSPFLNLQHSLPLVQL